MYEYFYICRIVGGGITSALIHAILIFGAHFRSSKAIFVWMFFQIIALIYAFYVGGKSVVCLTKAHAEKEVNSGWLIYGIFISVTNILFVLWTILVAKAARSEIKVGEAE